MFTIYGTPKCVNCTSIKNLFDNRSISYDYREVGKDITKDQLQEQLGRFVRSVPVIINEDGVELTFEEAKKFALSYQ